MNTATNTGLARNLLDRETSPYLLQHKDNPVHWRAWGPQALDEAALHDKPILLSVGYAACHWCHVMAHESFEDDTIAHLMNNLFVNIKVDREERPDIDAIYQHALGLMGEHGGWPLTMFLTPQGEPFWGGTYFPPEPRWGRAGFPQVLNRIGELYRNEPELVEKNRAGLVEALGNLSTLESDGSSLRADSVEQVARSVIDQIDFDLGGLSGAPKFPQPSLLKLFWLAWRKTREPNFKRAVTFALDRMCEGGIYDHLGGGFARYSVDAHWLVPHFEKMLYDNAQLLELLCLAWQADQTPLFAARARETCDWLLREMIAENGAFAATLDADSEGEEGKFYVWSHTQVEDVLGEDATFFGRFYDVSEAGNWEGKIILNRLALADKPSEDDEDRLAPLKDKLLHARASRVRPGWDDKVLADWNGLMITALVGAANVFEVPEWHLAAMDAYIAVMKDMSRQDDAGRLRLNHSFRTGQAKHEGVLDDYANMARAALALYEACGADRYLVDARALSASADEYFWDDAGGYFFTASDAEALIVRTKNAIDSALPSGNSVMLDVLTRLYLLCGEEHYRSRAASIADAFSAKAVRQAGAFAALITGFDSLSQMKQIVIIGAYEDRATQTLIQAVHLCPLPDRLLQVIAPGTELPDHHPAAGKTQEDGKATAYLCTGQVCSLPFTDPAVLSAALNETH